MGKKWDSMKRSDSKERLAISILASPMKRRKNKPGSSKTNATSSDEAAVRESRRDKPKADKFQPSGEHDAKLIDLDDTLTSTSTPVKNIKSHLVRSTRRNTVTCTEMVNIDASKFILEGHDFKSEVMRMSTNDLRPVSSGDDSSVVTSDSTPRCVTGSTMDLTTAATNSTPTMKRTRPNFPYSFLKTSSTSNRGQSSSRIRPKSVAGLECPPFDEASNEESSLPYQSSLTASTQQLATETTVERESRREKLLYVPASCKDEAATEDLSTKVDSRPSKGR